MYAPLICFAGMYHQEISVAHSPHIKSLEMIKRSISFKRLAVPFDKDSFICQEQEGFDVVLYINFAATLCNFDQCSMIVHYKKANSNIAHFVGPRPRPGESYKIRSVHLSVRPSGCP